MIRGSGLVLSMLLAHLLAPGQAAAGPVPGDTELISVIHDAPFISTEPNGPIWLADVSDDGRLMLVASRATNLTPEDADPETDVLVYDRSSQTFTLVSIGSDGQPGDGESGGGVIGPDGTHVLFSSFATNLDPDDRSGGQDVYLHDLTSRESRLVSVSITGSGANARSYPSSISAGGRFVTFSSTATDLVEGEQLIFDRYGDYPTLYLRDMEQGTTIRITENAQGEPANAESFAPLITADGRYVVYSSYATNLIPGDDLMAGVVLYDVAQRSHTRIDLNEAAGEAPNGASAISRDGRWVLFTSNAPNLVPPDAPEYAWYAFLLDRQTSELTRIDVPDVSGVAMSDNGDYVVLSSSIETPTGTSQTLALYDRRSGSMEPVIVTHDGGLPQEQIGSLEVSSDGRYVMFESLASNIVEGDAPRTNDVFVHDRHSGTTARIGGEPQAIWAGNAASDAHPGWALSGEGRYAAFVSAANNLVPDDTNGWPDVFVRDLVSGTTERVSVATGGGQADGESDGAAISADGRYVVFTSSATNLVDDPSASFGLYLHDRVTGTTTLLDGDARRLTIGFVDVDRAPSISADGTHVAYLAQTSSGYVVKVHDRSTGETEVLESPAGIEPDDPPASQWVQHRPSISADGRYVAFVSAVHDGWPSDLYVHDRQLGATRLISGGTGGSRQATSPAISADGRFVAFDARQRLVAADIQSNRDVYLRDLVTGTIQLISVDSSGNVGNGDSSMPSISADGRYVAFESEATNLISVDTNGARDVFVHDRLAGTTVRVSGNEAGTEGDAASERASISADGSLVLFSSEAGNLTPETPAAGGERDVFLHRVGSVAEARPFSQDRNGLVAIEAEHYYVSLLGHSPDRPLRNPSELEPWKAIPVMDASGREAIQADPRWPQTLDPAAAPLVGYGIHFQRTGPHYVWIRARSFSAQGDAYGIFLNNEAEIVRHVEPDDGRWVWLRGWHTVDVPHVGVSRLWLNRREGRVEIDKIVVTTDPGFTPSGLGPAESDRTGRNASPMLEPIGDQIMRQNEILEIPLRATDADGDLLEYSLPQPGLDAELTDHGDGNATLTFRPSDAELREYAIRVLVTDHRVPGVSDEETFRLTVVPGAFIQGDGGMLTLEAEHFQESRQIAALGRWVVIDDPWASGGTAIRDGGWWQSPRRVEEPGSVAYAVELTRRGPHYVWIRGRSSAARHDAFYLQLDDGPRLERYVEPDAAGWVWNRGWRQIEVQDPGLHVLRVYGRDPRVEIDKIVITPWPGYQPLGKGPGESPYR